MRRAIFAAAVGFACLGSLPSFDARAEELRSLYRGTKTTAMGGASVAVVDDEEAIWENPAGLAGVRKSSLNYAVLDTEISTDVISSISDLSSFNNFNASTVNKLMGKDIYARAQFSPSFVMPNFGASLLVDQQLALLAKNQALPQINLGYQTTDGVQVAFGTSVLHRGKRNRGRSDLRVGAAAKMLWRRGGYQTLGFDQLLNVSQQTIKDLEGNYGMGMGADIGTQYLYQLNSRATLSSGLAMTDIGNVKFSSGAAPVNEDLAWGLGFRYRLNQVTATLAWDLHYLNVDTDWRKRNHLGAEIELPLLTLYLGINQVYLTYGVAFDLWLFRVTAASYTEEQGVTIGQDAERRYLLQLALKFGM